MYGNNRKVKIRNAIEDIFGGEHEKNRDNISNERRIGSINIKIRNRKGT